MYGYRKLIGLVVAFIAEILLILVGINIPETFQAELVTIIMAMLGIGEVAVPVAYGIFVKGNVDSKKAMNNVPVVSPIIEQVPLPFNQEDWEKRIDSYTASSYGIVTEITRFYASIDMLGSLPPDPTDYTTALKFDISARHGLAAYKEKFGFFYAESEKHLLDDKKCQYYSVPNMARQKGIDFWSMLIKVERALYNARFDCYNWSGLAIP